MDCFGEVQKLPMRCSEVNRSLINNRFATTNLPEQILITESANLVSKYDLKERKSVDNWSFDELNKLLNPLVVYYPYVGKKDPKPQETLLGLHSGNTVIEWAPTELRELRPKLKKKLKKPIAAILSFPIKSKFDPLIVFTNGYVQHWDNVKSDQFDENAVEPVIAPNEEIIAINHFSESPKYAKLYFIVQSTVTKEKTIYKSIVYNKKSSEVTRTEKVPLTVDIEKCAFSAALGGFIGATKKDDKILFYSLEPEKCKNSDPAFSFEIDASDTLCSIAITSNGTIVVLFEKAPPSDVLFQVQVFEKKYPIKIGVLNFSDEVLTRDFTVVNNHAVITCKSTVVIVPIENQHVRLSELLSQNLNGDEKTADNTGKFKELVGVGEQEQTRDLKTLKELNTKFSIIAGGHETIEDIPEELIVSLFNFCTSNYLAIEEEENVNEKLKLLKNLKRLFSYLVKLPYNDVFLVSCLKSSSISMAQYLLAIEWLLNLMPCKDCSVISWISALLDANFRQFIIKPSAEAQAALNRIYFHLNQSIRFYEDLGPIKTMFESLVKCDNSIVSALSPDEKHHIGQYSIELLSFT